MYASLARDVARKNNVRLEDVGVVVGDDERDPLFVDAMPAPGATFFVIAGPRDGIHPNRGMSGALARLPAETPGLDAARLALQSPAPAGSFTQVTFHGGAVVVTHVPAA